MQKKFEATDISDGVATELTVDMEGFEEDSKDESAEEGIAQIVEPTQEVSEKEYKPSPKKKADARKARVAEALAKELSKNVDTVDNNVDKPAVSNRLDSEEPAVLDVNKNRAEEESALSKSSIESATPVSNPVLSNAPVNSNTPVVLAPVTVGSRNRGAMRSDGGAKHALTVGKHIGFEDNTEVQTNTEVDEERTDLDDEETSDTSNLPAVIEAKPIKSSLPVRVRVGKKQALSEEYIEGSFKDVETSHNKKFKAKSSLHDDKDVDLTYAYTVDWSDLDIDLDVDEIIEKLVQISEMLSGMALHEYQKKWQRRVFMSVLLNDGEEITALFARQGGKSEAVAQSANTLLVMMPILARVFPKQLGRYSAGFRIGLFAPTGEQAHTTHERMDQRLSSEEADVFLSDGDIDSKKQYSNGMLQVYGPEEVRPNGKRVPSYHSYCRVQSAAKQTKIESKTYDMVIIEEAQEMDTLKVQKSIHPMCASTNGTILKIGTPLPKICDFYHAILRNRRKESKMRVRNHFEFDYKVIQKYNPRYKAYIQRERERLGEASDAFRMAYMLEWLLDQGMAVTPQMFDEYMRLSGGKFEYAADPDAVYVAGLDLAKETDSTVLTIARIDPDSLAPDADEREKHIKTVVNWIEMSGDNWEHQFEVIVDTLGTYNIKCLGVDSTGVGDPIVDRLERVLEESQITLVPVIFSQKSKNEMAVLFYEEMRKQRIKIPCHQSAKKSRRWKNFTEQMFSCLKVYSGKYMNLKHPDEKGAHDDYVDSLLLLCYAANEHIVPSVRMEGTLSRLNGSVQGNRSKRMEQAMNQMKSRRAAHWRRNNA